MRGTGRLPDHADVVEAREKVGMSRVRLDEAHFTVRFAREGVMVDLGSIGKGYALERAAELLRETGVTSGILHGGTSTVYALGSPPNSDAWKVAVPKPEFAEQTIALGATRVNEPSGLDKFLAVVPLNDEALSVSAVWGKSFSAGDRVYGHVIDPRKGEPVDGAVLAAVALPSATESDALSTALLILGAAGYERAAGLRAGMRTLVVSRSEQSGQFSVRAKGIHLVEPAPAPS